MADIEFVDHSTVHLIRTNATDIDVCRAAWVSHDTEADKREADTERVKGLINFLWRNGHHSPFEHGAWTFKIDTPIFVAREFHRSRTQSYNEVSGRYSELKPRFYVPPKDRPLVQSGKVGSYTFVAGSAEQVERSAARKRRTAIIAWEDYQADLSDGIAREVARQHLPVNLMTTFIATVNTRNLMHFLDLRTDAQAMYEIREVADEMSKHFAEHMPITFNAWQENRSSQEVPM